MAEILRPLELAFAMQNIIYRTLLYMIIARPSYLMSNCRIDRFSERGSGDLTVLSHDGEHK